MARDGRSHLHTKDKNAARSKVLKEKWAAGEFKRRELSEDKKAAANLKRSTALKGRKQDPEVVAKRRASLMKTLEKIKAAASEHGPDE